MTPETLAELRRLYSEWQETVNPYGFRLMPSGEYYALVAAAVNALPDLLDAAAERERMREGRDDSPRDEDGWATPGQMWAMLLDSPLNERMALLRAALRAMDAEHRCIVGFHHEAVQQRDALAAKVARVRDWLDHRGVDASDRDGAYMDGYRAAQRLAVIDAAELRAALDEEPQP